MCVCFRSKDKWAIQGESYLCKNNLGRVWPKGMSCRLKKHKHRYKFFWLQ